MWSCEQWMDWVETASPVALFGLKWPSDMQEQRDVFNKMWTLLRQLVLHYCRGTGQPITVDDTLRAAGWSLDYAAFAEAVCPCKMKSHTRNGMTCHAHCWTWMPA